MIKYLLMFTICLAANPLDRWVDLNAEILQENIKSVSFQLSVESGLNSEFLDGVLTGKIVIGKNKQFRYELGHRTVISDGEVWKSYDERTDQIFIQNPNKKLEKLLFSWVKIKKIKSLHIKIESDGSCRIKLLGNKNDVRVYFNEDSNEIESIIIKQGDIRSEISKIKIAVGDTISLNIGSINSVSFDLR